MIKSRTACVSFVVATACALLFTVPTARADTSYVGESELVSWSCTGSPCPWGTWLDGHALVWPEALDPASTRFGYTTSGAIYLPAEIANRVTVWIDSGSATLYAGYPDSSPHRVLATLSDSYHFDVTELAPGEVLSVQGNAAFGYQIDIRQEPQPEVPPVGTPSQMVTWNCTGAYCPWGGSTANPALVWPEFAEAVSSRFDYTTSKPIYLPATRANGTAIRLESGLATVYAGAPNASSHRVLTTLAVGVTYEISGVNAGEVVSVQSDNEFRYVVDVAEASEPEGPGEPEGPSEPEPPPPGGGSGGSGSSSTSQSVSWTCTSSPCPWGDLLWGHAQAWPTEQALSSRLGYTTSEGIYLPASLANGTKLLLNSGSASLYAGLPETVTHRLLTTLVVGVEYEVTGLLAGEVLSVQDDNAFDLTVAFSDGQPPQDPPQDPPPSSPELPADAIHSIPAWWRCDIPECTTPDWISSVINWPSWAAYANNNRAGENSRTVYAADGGMLYPYMGSWAHGCEVTVHSGTVLIIEWERGTDTWRETWVHPGETHVIQLVPPEDGAMIETSDGHFNDFVVTLNNCTPQPLP